jgi:hypothetical protein
MRSIHPAAWLVILWLAVDLLSALMSRERKGLWKVAHIVDLAAVLGLVLLLLSNPADWIVYTGFGIVTVTTIVSRFMNFRATRQS